MPLLPSPSLSESLIALLRNPVASDADADARFSDLEQRLRASGDRRGPFATLYAMTTTNVIAAIARGDFEDGAWAGGYLQAFAELYRKAFYGYLTGERDAVPNSWRVAFDTAASAEELVIQDLALGVNAHVMGDLAYALVRVGIGEDDATRASRHRDHLQVNAVLHAELQAAVARISLLYAPGLGMLPAAAADYLENLFFKALVAGRDLAWTHALRLADGGLLEQDEAKGAILVESTAVAKGILAPLVSGEVMAALRAIEDARE